MDRFISKRINGKEYTYDRVLDVIFVEHYVRKRFLDRTQTDIPVDICFELTTQCNFACRNCFSDSSPNLLGKHADMGRIRQVFRDMKDRVMRVAVTGGEPLLYSGVDEMLSMPKESTDCGFVWTTNLSVRPDLDSLLIDYGWLVAVSINGGEVAHNAYTKSNSFRKVVSRVKRLARETNVHMYCVLNDLMTAGDVDLLYHLRDEVGASFLRFQIPRGFGRHALLKDKKLVEAVLDKLDNSSGLKRTKSLTQFLEVDGTLRFNN